MNLLLYGLPSEARPADHGIRCVHHGWSGNARKRSSDSTQGRQMQSRPKCNLSAKCLSCESDGWETMFMVIPRKRVAKIDKPDDKIHLWNKVRYVEAKDCNDFMINAHYPCTHGTGAPCWHAAWMWKSMIRSWNVTAAECAIVILCGNRQGCTISGIRQHTSCLARQAQDSHDVSEQSTTATCSLCLLSILTACPPLRLAQWDRECENYIVFSWQVLAVTQ